MTRVVNIRKEAYDVYIGRSRLIDGNDRGRWGNPFSHRPASRGTILVRNRDQAVDYFARWLAGDPAVCALLPASANAARDWILSQVHELHGKRLGCFCAPEQ